MDNILNQNIDWDTFNGNTYRRRYFDPISDEDAWVAEQILRTFHAFRHDGEIFENGIDVGCGPSLVPTLASVPFVKRLTLLEPGIQNINYLKLVLNDQSSLERDWKTTLDLLRTHPYSVSEHQYAARLSAERALFDEGMIQTTKDGLFHM